MIIFACFSSIGFSQDQNSRVYIKVHTAYGFLSPGSFKANTSKPLSTDTSIFKVSNKGMGEGFRFGAGIGLFLKDYLSVGIDGEYLKGSTLKSFINQAFTGTTVNSTTTIDYAILSIIPNVTIQAISNPKFIIYNRLGVIIGIPSNMEEDYYYKFAKSIQSNQQQVITTTYHAEYRLKNSIGFQVSIGLQKKISDNLSGFVEISGSSLSLNRVVYEEITRSRIEEIHSASSPPIAVSTDYSRNIVEYKDEGSPGVIKTGTGDNIVYTYTYAQDPVNINAIFIGIGITFRF